MTATVAYGLAPPADARAHDGRWEKIPFSATDLEPGAKINAVVAFDDSLFAVGSVFQLPTSSAPNEFPLQAAVWRSADGRHWQRVEAAAFGPGQFEDVVATDTHLVGFVQPSGGNSGNAGMTVWSSSDGTQWHLVTEAAPTGIRDVSAAGDVLVAAGAQADANKPCQSPTFTCLHAAIWTSPDGREWTRAGPTDEFPAGAATGVAPTSQGLVAIGYRSTGTPTRAEPLVWSSRNTTDWQRVQNPVGLAAAYFGSGGIANRQATILSIGVHVSDRPPTSTTTTTTTAPTTTTLAPGGGTVSIRLCAVINGSTSAWTTDDGQRWQRVATPALRNTTVTGVIATHGLWLAGGTEGDCNSTSAVVYSSTDGRRWQQAVSDPPTESHEPNGPLRSVTALTATKAGALAVVGSFDSFDSATGPDIWLWTKSS